MTRCFATLIIMLVLSLSASAQPCQRAVRDGRLYSLDNPGRYCFDEDYAAPSLFDWHAMRKGGYEGLVYIHASHTSVDFQGHVMTIDTGANFFLKENNVFHDAHWPTDLTIKNGKLKGPATYGAFFGAKWIPSISGFSVQSVLSDIDPKFLNDSEILSGTKTYGESFREDFFKKRKMMPPASRFPHGGYVLENMRIRLTNQEESIGALLGGADNIVRNCVIEVDGAIGLYVVGPRALVEGNTIIIHSKAAPIREANAAIKLDHADGSVIRNNRIVIKDGAAKPTQVIALIESEGVTIDNNIVYGDMPSMVKAFDEQSKWTELGTQRKSMMRWWFE